MSDGQSVQRRQSVFMLAAEDHEHIVETGVADLADRPPYQRLAVERQQQLLGAHAG